MDAPVNCVIIGSGNGLSPERRQATIWTNADIFSIRPLGTNFGEIQIKIQNFSFTKRHLKISSAIWWPFFPGGDELTAWGVKYSECISKSPNGRSIICIIAAITKPLNQYVKVKWLFITFQIPHISSTFYPPKSAYVFENIAIWGTLKSIFSGK